MSVVTPNISLRDLSYILPDGRRLLENLNESFGKELAALVGRNGVGKTMLAKLMAGLLLPSSGSVLRNGSVFYLDQMTDPSVFGTVADLAQISEVLNAVRRVEKGESNPQDFDLADGNWDAEERAGQELCAAGLDYLTPDTPTSRLSGGECTRVALVGAFLSRADFLILDEPTNHLDVPNRRTLMAYLETWKKGLLVVSHDRELLGRMERVVELSSHGLKSYGGNYTFYRESKEREHQADLSRLEHAKTERKCMKSELQAAVERQRHRAAQGRKSAVNIGMPKVMLHAMRGSAEKTAGALQKLKTEKVEALATAEKEAFLKAGVEDAVVLIPPACFVHATKVVLRVEGIVLPYGAYRSPIDWTMTGPERAAIEGANGSGKTTLLRVLKGEIAPLAGTCQVKVPYTTLDQFAGVDEMDEKRSSVDLLRSWDENLDLREACTRLAQIGIAQERLKLPLGVLSGGERVKVMLLCAIHRKPSPQLLILDEPTNHLDLNSVESVEKLLNTYTGALIVVSHDIHLLENIGVTRKIRLAEANRNTSTSAKSP
ncbi:MAG: ATP-binding cassette domain-containing protein [Synergistaceae bacterium]|jgi:ATPase subunit of ABC transporter with duplicated ATPase domains|nr:ATP-binding cassette domain-containing protein [Synergistaceae bacterium]